MYELQVINRKGRRVTNFWAPISGRLMSFRLYIRQGPTFLGSVSEKKLPTLLPIVNDRSLTYSNKAHFTNHFLLLFTSTPSNEYIGVLELNA